MRNIGIFAHVDAGKTTLSEQLLFTAGAIRSAGSVDSGTAHTDSLSVERQRGISVRSSCVRLNWKNEAINLIDTPGHTDFSAEIERSLWAPDGAVMVVCGAEGVQPQTELLFEALRKNNLPVMFFINKLDREGADFDRVLNEIKRTLSAKAVSVADRQALTEALCDADDALMEKYLSGDEIGDDELKAALTQQARRGEVFPVLGGSALKRQGIEAVLDGIVDFLPPPETVGEALSGTAFAIARDRLLGKGLWVRLFGGRLTNRDTLTLPGRIDPVTGERTLVQSKITQIRGVDGADAGSLSAGEIGVVYGVGEMNVGHVLGDSALLPRRVTAGELRSPLITVKVQSGDASRQRELAEACRLLSEEDPLLGTRFISSTGEINMDAMGAVQLEILASELKSRFGLDAAFGEPTVIYKETVKRPAEGFCAYTMPKPCWAILRFAIKPAPRGSGVSFHSEVPGREILPRYQHQVEQAIPLALSQGRLGWQVTDVDITLIGGSHHQFHTHPLDFIVATPWAIQDGLRNAGSALLEPVLRLNISVPQECAGRVISDVNTMRGEVEAIESLYGQSRIIALVPASECMDYPIRLAQLSSGRGGMSARLNGYSLCPEGAGKTAPRKNVDPLDTAKYILAARSALEGGIFDI